MCCECLSDRQVRVLDREGIVQDRGRDRSRIDRPCEPKMGVASLIGSLRKTPIPDPPED